MRKYNIKVIYNSGGSFTMPALEANNFLRAAITGRKWARTHKDKAKLLVVSEYGGSYSQTYIL
jgi:hypothetical protein